VISYCEDDDVFHSVQTFFIGGKLLLSQAAGCYFELAPVSVCLSGNIFCDNGG